MKPIWYFVGLMLLLMGILIFVAGIYQYFNPPAVQTVLAGSHANIWWGAIMTLFGGLMYSRTRRHQV
ncbi:MAG: hypothetical protein HY562_05660 [Ignavibacteriales bacterium]|nr:hypothetical protein [Ignavibacteriales bacterium]